MFQENKARQIFQKTNISYTLIHTRQCSFFGKFGVLCFLETLVLRFAILFYYRRTFLVRSSSQISLLILSEFERIISIPLKSSETAWKRNFLTILETFSIKFYRLSWCFTVCHIIRSIIFWNVSCENCSVFIGFF